MIKFSTIFLSVMFSINLNAEANNNVIANNTNQEPIEEEVTTNNNPILIHNADVGIFPGEANGQRKVIPKGRILAVNVDIVVSGIKAADHGKKILVIATNGSITFLANSSSSSNGNRIAYHSNMTIDQGDAFELTYNGNIGKWVITDTDI